MTVTLPGLFDLQVNGFGGVDFNGAGSHRGPRRRGAPPDARHRRDTVPADADHLVVRSVRRERPHPARSSATRRSPASTWKGRTCRRPTARAVRIRAAHVAAASVDDFRRRQDAAEGRIVLVTLAPEVPGALALIEHLVAAKVRVAIGHTAATPQQLADAIAAGATLATHLGNGCPQMLPRHPNVIWELLAADAVLASVIADGHHLPAVDGQSRWFARRARAGRFS